MLLRAKTVSYTHLDVYKRQVTHNIRDFRGCEKLGVQAVTPHHFLKMVNKT